MSLSVGVGVATNTDGTSVAVNGGANGGGDDDVDDTDDDADDDDDDDSRACSSPPMSVGTRFDTLDRHWR